MYARPFINSQEFSRNGQEISGEVPLAGLPRLQDVLVNPQGILSYTIRGGVDRQGSHFLDVNVTGSCQLRCQRCLEGMEYQALLDTRLILRDQASLDALDATVTGGEEEEFDSILADMHLDVHHLLEDEILLSLPFAPKHESGACQVLGEKNRQQEELHPFAVLEKFKRS